MYMLSKLILLLSLGFIIVESRSDHSDEDFGEVIFVNVLYRHGARTPERHYKNDPYKDAFPEGPGQLTNEGKSQHYSLGKWLRQRYNRLLTDKYSYDKIYVLASDKDRVLMSAQCNLAGMFPPTGDQVWNRELNWQPIPVHTVPLTLDKLIYVNHPCPAKARELGMLFKSDKMLKLRKKHRKILEILIDNTGETPRDDWLFYISTIYDTLLIESQHNLTLPKWSKGIFPKKLRKAAILSFTTPTWNQKLARLTSGQLLKHMIGNINEKIDNKSKRVMNVYSGHDLTIVSLFNTLGVYDRKALPPYAACVMMELRVDNDGSHYVTLFYRTTADNPPRLLTLPECDAACPLDQFIDITKPVIPEDWDNECKQTEPVDE